MVKEGVGMKVENAQQNGGFEAQIEVQYTDEELDALQL